MVGKIELTEDLLIGKGTHKKTYEDPTDASRCIKILFVVPDVDLERELQYRHSREKRRLKSRMLSAYYGEVETNMGKGVCFRAGQGF